MSKKKEERQLQIRQILEEKEKIKVAELAKLLSVTPETLRKDLDELQERKILVREHGYAKIQSSSVETFVELKAHKNKEMKKIVALEAFSRIIMAGGLLFNIGKRTYGHFATEIIDHLNIDLAIMGTDAFTEKSHGFTTISADELGFKRHVMNQSAKKIMISDASKVNNKADIAPYAFCKFNEFDEFITNHLTPEQYDVVKTVKKVTQV